jgi:hypothetical protein
VRNEFKGVLIHGARGELLGIVAAKAAIAAAARSFFAPTKPKGRISFSCGCENRCNSVMLD